MNPTVPHLLHVFPSFETGGAQRRFLTLARGLGSSYRHTVLAMDGNFTASKGVDAGLNVTFRQPAWRKDSLQSALRFRSFISRLRPAITLTYNWGAIDAVVGAFLACASPVIHTEDGFGRDEANQLKARRVLARRMALNRIYQTVVPSLTLYRIALQRYRVAQRRLRFIPNGVDTVKFRPGLSRRHRSTLGIGDEALLFGYAGHLRPEKNLGLLLSAFIKAEIPKAKLLILGSGPCEAELRRLAEELKAGERVVFHEATPDPAPFYAAMDVFVLSSSTEQMPISLLEAMACGLPAVCTDVGDVKTMLDAPEGALPPKGDTAAYVQALKQIAADRQAREAVGIANRARCESFYGVEAMIGAYRSLYQEAVCRWS